MQLFALDKKNVLTNARNAAKRKNYTCLECGGRVHLRGGHYRQLHFYHIKPSDFCRQHQKGLKHIAIQSRLQENLPLNDGVIECSFPEIKRIADVAWLSEKIVFEIQYSPISQDEVLSRISDYRSVGWEVVWILHDDRYNKKQLSPAEKVLHSFPHYFSNINARGEGIIYDQFSHHFRWRRIFRLPPLKVDLSQVQRDIVSPDVFSLKCLQERAKNWPLFFEGDLMNRFLSKSEEGYFTDIQRLEREIFLSDSGISLRNLCSHIISKWLVRPYFVVFHHILEKMCR